MLFNSKEDYLIKEGSIIKYFVPKLREYNIKFDEDAKLLIKKATTKYLSIQIFKSVKRDPTEGDNVKSDMCVSDKKPMIHIEKYNNNSDISIVCDKALRRFKKREAKCNDKAKEDLANGIIKIYYQLKSEKKNEQFTTHSINGYRWDDVKKSEKLIRDHFEEKVKIVKIPSSQFKKVKDYVISEKLQKCIELYFGSFTTYLDNPINCEDVKNKVINKMIDRHMRILDFIKTPILKMKNNSQLWNAYMLFLRTEMNGLAYDHQGRRLVGNQDDDMVDIQEINNYPFQALIL